MLYANIEQRVQYITKLYNSEFQVLARNDIKSYDDLRGKKVNFNLKDSQTEVTADTVFNASISPCSAPTTITTKRFKRLKSGELAAMIILTGAPQVTLSKVKKEDGLHFLPLDQESLPKHDLRELSANYLPAELTHEHYPNLGPRGDLGTDHRKSRVARRLYVAGEFPALQKNRKIHRRVLQQDQ